MPSPDWTKLLGEKKVEALEPDPAEIEHNLELAREFRDIAARVDIPERQRFLNLYEAAHSLALAGMLLGGYRPKEGDGNRYLSLSLAEDTLALRKGSAAAFTESNRLRARQKYHGVDTDFPESTMEALEAGVEEALEEVRVRLKALRARKKS